MWVSSNFPAASVLARSTRVCRSGPFTSTTPLTAASGTPLPFASTTCPRTTEATLSCRRSPSTSLLVTWAVSPLAVDFPSIQPFTRYFAGKSPSSANAPPAVLLTNTGRSNGGSARLAATRTPSSPLPSLPTTSPRMARPFSTSTSTSVTDWAIPTFTVRESPMRRSARARTA
jgi:hypothetical protein